MILVSNPFPGLVGGAAIRGGNWNNGTNAGLFNANLNNDSSNANNDIGARCVWALGDGDLSGECVKDAEACFVSLGHINLEIVSQGTSGLNPGLTRDFGLGGPKLKVENRC